MKNFTDRRSLLGGISAFGLLALTGCGGSGGGLPPAPVPTPPPAPTPPPIPSPPPTTTTQIRGFNQNWSQLPPLTTGNMVALMRRLRPSMIRYPGGTVTHGWDWRAGQLTSRPSSQIHPIADVKSLSDALGAPVIVVLDIIYRTLDDQLDMLRELQRIGVPFSHIELGNEVYARDDGYIAKFPTGIEYGAEANRWAAAVKAEFPQVKVAAVLFAREVGDTNPRGQNWNADILRGPTTNIDAWIFHIYIGLGLTAAGVMDNYRAISDALPLGSKPIWITEYGNQNETAADYLTELLKLADLVQAQTNVTIALNHQMIGGDKNKMALDALALNAEGDAFARRVDG
jgi:hypothetical protein